MTISEFHKSSIIEVSASFGFSEFACSPHTLSEILGIKPDSITIKGSRTTIKGSPFKLLNARTFEETFNSWSITSESQSKDINVHIRQLLKRLEGLQYSFSKKWGEPSFGIHSTVKKLDEGNVPFYEPDVLVGIVNLTAAIYQDIYQVDQKNSGIENKLTLVPK